MIVRKLRLQRGWSQEQLAEFSGLSIRTIQRIERGQRAGLDTLKSLAAVFEVPLTSLQPEERTMSEPSMSRQSMPQTSISQSSTHPSADSPSATQPGPGISPEEEQAIAAVRDIKGFYSHLTSYVCVITLLWVINWLTGSGYYWAKWPTLGWGIGIVSHALSVWEVFNFFGPDWEKRQIEKRLGRKL